MPQSNLADLSSVVNQAFDLEQIQALENQILAGNKVDIKTVLITQCYRLRQNQPAPYVSISNITLILNPKDQGQYLYIYVPGKLIGDANVDLRKRIASLNKYLKACEQHFSLKVIVTNQARSVGIKKGTWVEGFPSNLSLLQRCELALASFVKGKFKKQEIRGIMHSLEQEPNSGASLPCQSSQFAGSSSVTSQLESSQPLLNTVVQYDNNLLTLPNSNHSLNLTLGDEGLPQAIPNLASENYFTIEKLINFLEDFLNPAKEKPKERELYADSGCLIVAPNKYSNIGQIQCLMNNRLDHLRNAWKIQNSTLLPLVFSSNKGRGLKISGLPMGATRELMSTIVLSFLKFVLPKGRKKEKTLKDLLDDFEAKNPYVVSSSDAMNLLTPTTTFLMSTSEAELSQAFAVAAGHEIPSIQPTPNLPSHDALFTAGCFTPSSLPSVESSIISTEPPVGMLSSSRQEPPLLVVNLPPEANVPITPVPLSPTPAGSIYGRVSPTLFTHQITPGLNLEAAACQPNPLEWRRRT